MATKINIEQVCSVVPNPKKVNRDYVWREEAKHWFRKDEREGFYERWSITPELKTKEEIEKDGSSYVEGQKVYWKPHVHVSLSNNEYYEKFFKDEEQMNLYIADLKDKGVKLEGI